jgi:hypothetical protein
LYAVQNFTTRFDVLSSSFGSTWPASFASANGVVDALVIGGFHDGVESPVVAYQHGPTATVQVLVVPNTTSSVANGLRTVRGVFAQNNTVLVAGADDDNHPTIAYLDGLNDPIDLLDEGIVDDGDSIADVAQNQSTLYALIEHPLDANRSDLFVVDDAEATWRATPVGRVPRGAFVGVEFVVDNNVALIAARTVQLDGTTVGTLIRKNLR